MKKLIKNEASILNGILVPSNVRTIKIGRVSITEVNHHIKHLDEYPTTSYTYDEYSRIICLTPEGLEGEVFYWGKPRVLYLGKYMAKYSIRRDTEDRDNSIVEILAISLNDA